MKLTQLLQRLYGAVKAAMQSGGTAFDVYQERDPKNYAAKNAAERLGGLLP